MNTFKIKKIVAYLNYPRFLLHILFFLFSKNKYQIICDIQKALEHHSAKLSPIIGLIFLLTFDKYFRTVFYYRIGYINFFCIWLAKPPETFTIGTFTPIGKGLLAIHPFSTIINAKSIGDNFIIKNCVTIGNSKNGLPIIRDNVTINVGAIVVGDITLGNNVVVGAGAIVTKSIPDNCTVVGNPAYIVKKDGVKLKETI